MQSWRLQWRTGVTRNWYVRSPNLSQNSKPSTAIKNTMIDMDIRYQVLPPGNHRTNNTKRSIQTFKHHLISGICSVDAEFHLKLWNNDPTINNNTQPSKTNKATPRPICIRALIWIVQLQPHTTYPNRYNIFDTYQARGRASWSPHGEPGWYIGLAMEHCKFHKVYILYYFLRI